MKKQFRLTVYNPDHILSRMIKALIEDANKQEHDLSIRDIEGYLKCEKVLSPLQFENVMISPQDAVLFVDDNMVQVLQVEEIELHELTGVPTLDAYAVEE